MAYLRNMLDRKIGYSIICIIFVLFGSLAVSLFISYSTPKTKHIIAFPKVGNLRIDDPVRLRGVPNGVVRAIELSNKNVLVTVETEKPLVMHKGYSIVTMDAGLMGDRIIIIDNGNIGLPQLPAADTLYGVFYPGVSEAVGEIHRLADFVDTLKEISATLVKGSGTKKSLIRQTQTMVHTIDSISANVYTFTHGIGTAVPHALDSLDTIVLSASRLVRDVSHSGPRLMDSLSSGIMALDKIVSSADSVVSSFSSVADSIGKSDNILWKNDVDKIQADLATIDTTIGKIRKQLLQFRLAISF